MIVLCRHGETATNKAGRLQGRSDASLTDLGRVQAAALADRLAPALPSVLVASPARRAQETAAALGERVGLPVIVDEAFIELDYGAWDGLPVGDPSIPWDRWRADPGLRPPGGESLVDLRARVTAGCEALVDQHGRDAVVVVVTHVSPIKAAVVWATGANDGITWRMHLDLASITRVRLWPDGTPYLTGYNDTAHLQ